MLSQPKTYPLLSNLREAMNERPKDGVAIAALANALQARGETRDAVRLFERASQLCCGNESIYRSWAQALRGLGRLDEAAEVLREAVQIRPMPMGASRDLAIVLLDLNQHEEARELFTLISRRTHEFSAAVGLCECCLSGRSWGAAAREAACLMGLGREETLYPLVGWALINVGRVEEARECFRAALARAPNDLPSLLGAGDVAHADRDPDLALQYHTRARTENPNDDSATLGCFMDCLSAGRYDDARQVFRSARRAVCSRWGHGSHYSSRAPEWDGSSLRGKAILVHGAVGLADSIQFCRLLTFLKDQGCTVVLEVPVALRSLMQTLSPVDLVVCKFDPLPAIPLDFECDLREIFLLSDVPPYAFALSVPYIFPSPGLRRRWALSIPAPACLKIGLVWDGSRLVRWGSLVRCSVPLDKLSPLTEISNIRLYSLQVGQGSDDLSTKPWASDIVNLAPGIQDFVDTAAIISLLDVVVTIDTSVAHLAGAMAKHTFLMLPYSPSWRWETKREDSIWYPTLRLFRTEEPGNWEGVVARVKAAILGLSDSK